MKLKGTFSPLAIYGAIKELRSATSDERPIVVAGARGLVPVLARELAREGDASFVREGGAFGEVAVLVYILAGDPTEADERELREADRAGVPIVCVASGDGREVPYVLATNVIRVEPGTGFPVDEIARAIARVVGEPATALARRLPVLRDAVCAELIRSFARKNALVGAAVFLPGVDMPVLTLNQIRLVLRIAHAYGEEIDASRAAELLGVVGGGLGLRAVARELLDLVPVAGWALKGGMAYVGTRAVGEAAVRYFESRSVRSGS